MPDKDEDVADVAVPELPATIVLVSVAVPSRRQAAAVPAELPLTVQSVSVSVAPRLK